MPCLLSCEIHALAPEWNRNENRTVFGHLEPPSGRNNPKSSNPTPRKKWIRNTTTNMPKPTLLCQKTHGSSPENTSVLCAFFVWKFEVLQTCRRLVCWISHRDLERGGQRWTTRIHTGIGICPPTPPHPRIDGFVLILGLPLRSWKPQSAPRRSCWWLCTCTMSSPPVCLKLFFILTNL